MAPKYLLEDETASCLEKKIFSEMEMMEETSCLEATRWKLLSPKIFNVFGQWS